MYHREPHHGDHLTRRRNGKWHSELRTWYFELKKQYVCQSCGESSPVCIEFHHKNGEEKDFSISEAVYRGYTQKRILSEIKKCIPLCCNCHRKLHYSTSNADAKETKPDDV